MRYGLVCIVLAASACSLKADYNGTLYQCDPDGACPDQFLCIENRCVPTEPQAAECTAAVTTGNEHACAIRSDGTAWCWGRNDYGQLGDGTNTDRTSPVLVSGAKLPRFTGIAGGNSHSCAVGDDGTAWCWGHNDTGQLGDKTMGDGKVPVQVLDLVGATAIATGAAHSCARLGNGSLACWGANNAGQLGLEGARSSNTPVMVQGLNVTAVAAGGDTTCAIDSTRGLLCWGEGDSGQLGDGMQTSSAIPRPVPLSDVTGVAVGGEFACAMTSGGVVSCFGRNDRGQLGNPGGSSATPIEVPLPITAKAIAAGDRFACATDDQARVWCWGENDNYQLADTTGEDHALPALTTYTNIMDLAGGGAHLCVRSAAGGITCSGYNGRGQLGDGHRTTQGTPQVVAGLAGVTSLAAGEAHTCATLDETIEGKPIKAVRCWGRNDRGEVGDGSRIERRKPTLVQDVQGATMVVVGSSHSCALLDDGTAKCWGANSDGQLGDGSFATYGLATPVAGLVGITQLAAGGSHTCALVDSPNGIVKCWGNNLRGQNGDNTTVDSAIPKPVVMLSPGVLGIAVGREHACAINGDRTVACWGYDLASQLGNSSVMSLSTVPVPVMGLANVDQLSAHGDFTCAHTTDDSVWCWGDGGDGQLGTGGYVSHSTPQRAISAGATKVASGGGHVCALKIGAPIACWGASYVGQLGDGGYGNHPMPAPISGTEKVIDIAGGDEHTCALRDDRSVSCWGDDRDGELGDGIAAKRTPVAPLLPCP